VPGVWASPIPERIQLLIELNAFFATAEQQLADFYVSKFTIDEVEALKFSKYALDHMLRRHFVYHRVEFLSQLAAQPPRPEGLR
jgi:hypothetical protein